MKGTTIAGIVTLSIFALVFLGFALYFTFWVSPSSLPSGCKFGCAIAPPYMNGPMCLSVLEKYQDSTIPTPTPQPYLSSFVYAPGAGAAFCLPVWYAFRYVRNSDGGYSAMSPWTNAPIYAGAIGMPWVTPPSTPVGNNVNQPTIVLTSPLDLPTSSTSSTSSSSGPNGYTLNVHRQVGSIGYGGTPIGFNPTSQGTIVGSFIVPPSPQNPIFTDAVFNPNIGGPSVCPMYS
jgi:hypothetical protein